MSPNPPDFKNGGFTAPQKTLAECSVNTPGSASAVIGSHGGRVAVGRNVFTVPPGALGDTVTISMRVAGDSSRSVEFQPAGLTFTAAASLTIDYSHCSFVAPAEIVYTSEQGQILETLPSVDQRSGHRVTAPIEHFSRYAVAY